MPGRKLPINEYFAAHPEQVAGIVDRKGKMYRGDAPNVSRTDDFEERFRAAMESIPENVMREAGARATEMEAEAETIAEGQIVLRDGVPYQKTGG